MSMCIQPLSGVKKSKSYINGSYTGTWNFSVYLRLTRKDTKFKIEAREKLDDLDNWFNEKDASGNYLHLPNLGPKNKAIIIEMTATPSIAMTHEDGVEDYQVIFSLIYKHQEA